MFCQLLPYLSPLQPQLVLSGTSSVSEIHLRPHRTLPLLPPSLCLPSLLLILPSNLFYMTRHPSQLLGKIVTLATFLESGADLRNATVYLFVAVSLLCPQVKNLCNCQPCLSNANSLSVHPSILFVNTFLHFKELQPSLASFYLV